MDFGFSFVSLVIISHIELQGAQLKNSAKDLGPPIVLGQENRLIDGDSSIKLVPNQLIKREPTASNQPPNPLVTISARGSQGRLDRVASVSTAVKFDPFRPTLELNSRSLKGKLVLPMGLGVEMIVRGQHNNLIQKPDVEFDSVLSLGSFTNWLSGLFSPKPKNNRQTVEAPRGIRVKVPQNQNRDNQSLSLEIGEAPVKFPSYEIEDPLGKVEALANSLDALGRRQLGKKTQISVGGNERNLSLGLKFPVLGATTDELEIKTQSNWFGLSRDGGAGENSWFKKISWGYKVALERTTKLEIQNEYDLLRNTSATYIRLTNKH